MAKNRLLLVDDQPLVLSALARFLEQKGYEVHTAANGQEGIDCANRMHPDLVITDIKMPVMDGWTLVKTLRSSGKFTLLPVIILADADDSENRMEGFRLGADDFVSKGTIVEELEVRIARALERSRSIHRAVGGMGEAPEDRPAPRPSAPPPSHVAPPKPEPASAPSAFFDLPPLAKTMGLSPTFASSTPAEAAEVSAETGPGMQGSLSDIGLASILTLLGSGDKSGVLSVTGPEEHERGQVILRDGAILRIRLDREPELPAVDAVARMIKWRQGKFVFSMQDVTARDEVRMPTEHLLMEASRLIDEGPG